MECKSFYNKHYHTHISSINEFRSAENYNIIDQYKGHKYNINENNYKEFFKVINKCVSNNICMHLGEVQKNNISCLDIDLDIKQNNDQNQFEFEEENIITKILYVLNHYCEFDKDFYVSVTYRTSITSYNTSTIAKNTYLVDNNTNITYNAAASTDAASNNTENTQAGIYKNGFHIKIFLNFSHNEKKFIISKIQEMNIFDSYKLTKNIVSSVFTDLQSLNASVLLYGSNKITYHDEFLYKISNIYLVNAAALSLSNNNVLDPIDINKFDNLPLELSILFQGNIITKNRGKFKVPIDDIILTDNDNFNRQINYSNNEDYVNFILFKIYKPCRYEDFIYWKPIILCLATIRDISINTAINFSKQWDKYDSKAQDCIERLWQWGLDRRPYNNPLKFLEKFAKEDNLELFEQACTYRYKSIIIDKLENSYGNVNDEIIASIIEEKYSDTVVYKNKNKSWYIFNEKTSCWDCEESEPEDFYKYVTEFIPNEIRSCINYINVKTPIDKNKYIDNLNLSLNKCANIQFFNHVVEHLKHKLRFDNIEFDSPIHDHIIGLGNGVFNLSTSKFVDDPKIYYITRHTKASLLNIPDINNWPNKLNDNYTYVSQVLSIISDIISDKESETFIMCYLASSLNFVRKSPIFFIWHGDGRNGKSTLDEMTQSTFGNINNRGYAYKIPSHFYCDSKDTLGPETAKMPLKYARYVGSGEINKGAKLHISRIKEITSDTISGNEKYGKQETFMAKCNYILSTNVKPNICSTDYGTIRRLYFYTFKNTFVDDEPQAANEKKANTLLYNLLLNDENYLNAFLEILIYYYMIFRDKYGEIIEKVPHTRISQESKTFYLEQDHLASFIDYSIEKDNSSKIQLSDFYTKYISWYKAFVDSNIKFTKNNIKDELNKTKLKQYIKVDKKDIYINKHRFIEEYERQVTSAIVNEAYGITNLINDDIVINNTEFIGCAAPAALVKPLTVSTAGCTTPAALVKLNASDGDIPNNFIKQTVISSENELQFIEDELPDDIILDDL